MKKMKIAFIEMYSHAEILRSFLLCLKNYEISIFVSSEFEMNELLLEVGNMYEIFARPKTQSIPEFITQNKDKLDSFDWLIFTTIENNFSFFAKQIWSAKTILLLHDGNYWLDYQRNISFSNFVDIGRWFRSLLYQQMQNRRKIVENIDFLMFPTPKIHNYFTEKKLLRKSSAFPSIPLYVCVNTERKNINHKEAIIVIPGTIRKNTRDYTTVFKAFESIISKVETPVQLVLLGSPLNKWGRKIQQIFQSLKCKNLSVICFPNQVRQVEYDSWLKKANFLILPLRGKMKFQECIEFGGLTKISGSINDMLRYYKPALVADGYAVEENMSSLITRYDNSESLGIKILEWVHTPPDIAELSLDSKRAILNFEIFLKR